MKTDCRCAAGESHFTGVNRVHVTKDMFNSPLGYLLSLGDGIHSFVQVQKYRIEDGTPLLDVRLALLEVIGGVWVRRATNTFLATGGSPLDERSKSAAFDLMADSQPFNASGLRLEYGQPRKEDRYGKIVVPLRCVVDLSITSTATKTPLQKTIEQTLLIEEELAFGCFGVFYRCGHDHCHTLCVGHNCNYHCESQICNNAGQCGDWQNAGPSCDPITCNG
jgi:hypothetical protein